MLSISFLLLSLFIFASTLFLRRRPKATKNALDKSADVTHAARDLISAELQRPHKLISAFITLVEQDGAGTWPPKANHSSWPTALCPYKEVYLEMVQHLSTATPSLDADFNRERRSAFRSSMRKLLVERVNIAQVKKIMQEMGAGNLDVLPRDQINGFYCTVAVCRHAYRWATIPVVKVAQAEKVVEFPPELDIPWPFLQRHFGVTADSGNNTSNVLLNFDEAGERVYKINFGISDLIRSSEEPFFRIFYDIEVMACPIYKEMIGAVVTLEENDRVACVCHLKKINNHLRTLLQIFYQNVKETQISHSVWLSYVQGFQGWGVGKMLNGEFVKYDGVSGNHILFFQALDAFLGLPSYLTEKNHVFYIPVHQRELCVAFREHSFWSKVDDQEYAEIRDQMTKIIKHLKLFRTAHRTRVMPYLEQPAPERLAMTAGKGVLEGQTTKEALDGLDTMMVTRLQQTSSLLTGEI